MTTGVVGRPPSPARRATLRLDRWLPVTGVMALVLGTLVLYQSRLIVAFPHRNDIAVTVLVVATLGLVVIGHAIGLGLRIRSRDPVDFEKVAWLGLASMVILLGPSVAAYTGRSVLELPQALLDPAAAHRALVETVQGSRLDRLPLLVARSLTSPFVVVAIPYFAMQYFETRRRGTALVASVLVLLLMSVARGTDKELFDALILVGVPWLVVAVRRDGARVLLRRVLGRRSLILLTLFVTMFAVFSVRRAERLGDVRFRCFVGTSICHDLPGAEDARGLGLGVALMVSYATQGYYGLGTAVDARFEPGFGLGHSRPLQFVGESLLGIENRDVVTAQLATLGWDTRNHWATALTWVANDIPLPLAPLAFLGVGLILGVSWKQALRGEGFLPVLVATYAIMTLVYFPAGLQVAQSGDLYIGCLFWGAIYALGVARSQGRSAA